MLHLIYFHPLSLWYFIYLRLFIPWLVLQALLFCRLEQTCRAEKGIWTGREGRKTFFENEVYLCSDVGKKVFWFLYIFNEPFITDRSYSNKIWMYLITLKAIFLSQPYCLLKKPTILAQSCNHTPLSELYFLN